MSAAHSAVERAGLYGHAAVNALVLDDWKALTDAHSSTLQRIEGGADLASWAIPEGKVAAIAGHALVKASELAAAHLTASGVEHAGAAATALAASRGFGRPLADAERSGHFQSFDDFKKFMGPATEPGGELKDWHHNVEKTHADDTHQFPAERVHSIENLMPVPRGPHQLKDGLTSAFSKVDPERGMSRREFLKGRPWEDHVDLGERALQNRGLDPNALRAETRARFEQRLAEHDRGLAPRSHEPPSLVLGPALSAEHDNGMRNASSKLHIERDGGQETVRPATHFVGRIVSAEDDRITQDIGRGHKVTWSRAELGAHFNDPKAFDAAMQPGNFVNVGIGRNGTVDAQQQVPGHGWESLNQQPLSQWQQFQAPDLGHSR